MGKGTSNYCCMRDIKYVNQNKHECNCITPPLNVIVTRNLNKNIKKKLRSKNWQKLMQNIFSTIVMYDLQLVLDFTKKN